MSTLLQHTKTLVESGWSEEIKAMQREKTKLPISYKKYPTTKVKNVLRWIGEMQIVKVTDAQKLLGRKLIDGVYDDTTLSIRKTDDHIFRLTQLGLVSRKRTFLGSYVYLTKRGYEYIGCPLNRTFPTYLQHNDYGIQARLWTESKHPDWQWIVERDPKCLHGARHRVDYNVIADDQIVGVQIEATPKDKVRLEDILEDTASTFKTIWYFNTPACMRLVAKTLNGMPHINEQFWLKDLSNL
jgi:hypothetical protein